MLWILMLACKGGVPGDSDTQDTDTAETGDSGGQVDVREGFCAPTERIGTISVERYAGSETSSFSVWIQEAPHPLASPATLESEACSHYEYTPGFCDGGCGPQQLCSPEGECVDTPGNLKDLELTLWADGVESTHPANEQGLIYGALEGQTVFEFALAGEGVALRTGELTLHSGLVATVSSEGDYDAPGELTVDWSGTSEGLVHTNIPINHHAQSQTFTGCQAAASAGSFTVPAEMVDPLAIHTGLEFQGLQHGSWQALETERGCIQVAVYTHHHANVEYPQ